MKTKKLYLAVNDEGDKLLLEGYEVNTGTGSATSPHKYRVIKEYTVDKIRIIIIKEKDVSIDLELLPSIIVMSRRRYQRYKELKKI